MQALDGLEMRVSDSEEREGVSVACVANCSVICPPATKMAPMIRKTTPKMDSVMNIGMLAVPLYMSRAAAVDADDPEELDKPAAIVFWTYW